MNLASSTHVKSLADPEQLRIEVYKQKAAFEASRKTDAFQTPRVLFERRYSFGSEYVPELVPMSSILERRNAYRAERAVFASGVALGYLHSADWLPTSSNYRALDVPGTEVVGIHGDFTVENVCFAGESDTPTLIDWSAAYWVDRYATHGPPAWDVSLFCLTLAYRFGKGRAASIETRRALELFLDGYSRKRSVPSDLAECASMASRLMKQTPASETRFRALKLQRLRWVIRLLGSIT